MLLQTDLSFSDQEIKNKLFRCKIDSQANNRSARNQLWCEFLVLAPCLDWCSCRSVQIPAWQSKMLHYSVFRSLKCVSDWQGWHLGGWNSFSLRKLDNFSWQYYHDSNCSMLLVPWNFTSQLMLFADSVLVLWCCADKYIRLSNLVWLKLMCLLFLMKIFNL